VRCAQIRAATAVCGGSVLSTADTLVAASATTAPPNSWVAASATQVGAALGADRHVCRVVPNPPEVTAGFTVIGITVSVPISHTLGASGFSAAFTAAAAVALAPAAMGSTIARTRQ